MMNKPESADQYINSFPADIKNLLEQMRETTKKAAPNAQEQISYGMPAYRQHSVLVYYAAQSKHIGLYPGAGAIVAFAEELKPFKTSKGAIQLPFDKPLPLDLVTRIIQYRIHEDQRIFEERQAGKKKAK